LSFIWPVGSYEIYQGYWSRHPAIDILLPVGSPVWASAPGVVAFAGWNERGYGQTIILDHGDGVRTRYAHLDAIYVRQGQEVAQHTLIGASGNSGNSDIPHLHFEMIVNYYRPANPCRYLEIRVAVPAQFVTDFPLPKIPPGLDCGRVVIEAIPVHQ
jgi:murein DD-endopeptidase MepM/ murein hydrolase activator NlpD